MLNVYLSGEIHTTWREEIIKLCKEENLGINFSSPVTDHDASDNCGVEILGTEEKNFWKDNKGAKINSIKTKNSIKHEEYKDGNVVNELSGVIAQKVSLPMKKDGTNFSNLFSIETSS